MRSPWGLEYARTPARYIWGRRPSPFARAVAALVPRSARILDLGAGEGRDSVYFAARGAAVTAVELSLAGIEKGKRLARARGVSVRWLHGDMSRVGLPGAFDLVFSCGSLHYVPRRRRPPLLRALASLTVSGGYHAHVVFTDRDVYPELGERIDYFTAGELAAAYRGWRVVKRREGRITCAADGTRHHHSIEWLIAARCARPDGPARPSAVRRGAPGGRSRSFR